MISIDLHSHSRVSDGLLAPRELVRHAAKQGVAVLALTDHDDTAGLEEAREEAALCGISLVSGTEISVTWRGRTVHVVGLRIDENDAALAAGLARLRASRHERAVRIAAALEAAGIEGSLEGARGYASEHVISRTHFARFLVAQGHAADMRGVFRKFLVKGKPGYVQHTWASLDEAVGWIRGAGGVAVLAHPGRYDLGSTLMRALLGEFRDLGGVAIEVVSGSHAGQDAAHFAALAREFGLMASCGSDYHGPGVSHLEMGRLPGLPAGCTPVWQDWPEVLAAAA